MKTNTIKYYAIVATERDRKELQELLRNPVICDDDLYHRCNQLTCPHKKTYVDGGVKYCEECWKALEVTIFRD